MTRFSLILYQPFCHFLSPCYDCVPCSCVRPGIQCGLSVRGTFRVSQNRPRPPFAPSHCLASRCGCLWGFLKPASNLPISQFSIRKLFFFFSVSSELVLFPLPPPTRHGAAGARLTDFPECTTLRSHRRHRRFHGSILEPLLFSAAHSQPCRSIHTPLIAPATTQGGASGKPLPHCF